MVKNGMKIFERTIFTIVRNFVIGAFIYIKKRKNAFKIVL